MLVIGFISIKSNLKSNILILEVMVKKLSVKINSTVTSVFSFTQYFFMLTLVL